ncbi:hypothetical protein Hanom_Chr03g00202621 [Helianthus anomalus]
MCVCIGYCERKWPVLSVCREPKLPSRNQGRCGGPPPGQAGPQPAPIPLSLIERVFLEL